MASTSRSCYWRTADGHEEMSEGHGLECFDVWLGDVDIDAGRCDSVRSIPDVDLEVVAEDQVGG